MSLEGIIKMESLLLLQLVDTVWAWCTYQFYLSNKENILPRTSEVEKGRLLSWLVIMTLLYILDLFYKCCQVSNPFEQLKLLYQL